MPTLPTPCPWCGSLRGVVQVHGHGQCLTCATNVEPCCAGDSVNDAATQQGAGQENLAAPTLFPSLFEILGGHTTTVTTEALLFALSNRLGTDYDQSRLVMEAAERVGILKSTKKGLHRLQVVVPSPVDLNPDAP